MKRSACDEEKRVVKRKGCARGKSACVKKMAKVEGRRWRRSSWRAVLYLLA